MDYIIDSFKSGQKFSTDEMERLSNMIEMAEYKEGYPFEFDVQKFKSDFATVMAMLEMASAKQEELKENIAVENEIGEVIDGEEHKNSKYLKYAGITAAVFAFSIISSVVAKKTRRI
jgi:hypothetical protein